MQNTSDETRVLTESTAREVLKEKGYDMSCGFGHVHALQGNREWHLCVQEALTTMDATRFLACLNDALCLSQNIDGPLVPLTETLYARA